MDLQGLSIAACSIVAPPGLRKIEYAPVDDVDQAAFEFAIDADYNQQATVPFNEGSWSTFPFAAGSAEWREDLQQADQGPIYQVSIGCRLAGDSPDIRGELNRMKQHRYVLRITGRDGVAVLVGSVEQPLRFESRYSTGRDGSDDRGYQCTFTGYSLINSPKYSPTF